MTDTFLYTPYYCEENIWHLCQHPALASGQRRAIFISNEARCCPLWLQRASPNPAEPVFWDYHVILIAEGAPWNVWDLDTLLPTPVPLPQYLEKTFGPEGLVPEAYTPRFRVLTPKEFHTTFSSDRSHMRDSDGQWLQPPPAWAPLTLPTTPMNLMSFVDVEQSFVGTVMDRTKLLDHFG